MKKNKSNMGLILTVVIYMAAGVACGILVVELVSSSIIGAVSEMDTIAVIGVLLLTNYAAMFLHIIIHEGGHYVCGRISGYKLASFRIGRIMLVKRNNKLELKRFMIAGTGGQCLMIPPICSDSSFSFLSTLYNLGGVAANTAAAYHQWKIDRGAEAEGYA